MDSSLIKFMIFLLSLYLIQCFPGALFAILASLESLCNFSSQLVFNPLYTWTVTALSGEFTGGITFFINAGLLLIPMILIGWVQ